MSNNGEYVPIEADYAYNDTSNSNRFVAFKNPFRYRSYYYDFETKLYYLNSRYYDPEIGRFINSDDVSILDDSKEFINGLNLYCYCNNNPVNYGDYTGKSLIALFLILLGTTILGGVVGGMTAYNNGARGWDLFKGIILGASFGLAVGGALIALGSVIIGAIYGLTAKFLGVYVLQSFAIGALAFDFTAYFITPIFGIEMQGIEVDTSNKSAQFTSNISPKFTILNETKNLTIKFLNKRKILNDRIQWNNIKKLQKLYKK